MPEHQTHNPSTSDLLYQPLRRVDNENSNQSKIDIDAKEFVTSTELLQEYSKSAFRDKQLTLRVMQSMNTLTNAVNLTIGFKDMIKPQSQQEVIRTVLAFYQTMADLHASYQQTRDDSAACHLERRVDNKPTIGEVIKAWREAHVPPLSIQALAKLCGKPISAGYLSTLERSNRVPRPETLARVAGGLGIETALLQRRTLPPTQDPTNSLPSFR